MGGHAAGRRGHPRRAVPRLLRGGARHLPARGAPGDRGAGGPVRSTARARCWRSGRSRTPSTRTGRSRASTASRACRRSSPAATASSARSPTRRWSALVRRQGRQAEERSLSMLPAPGFHHLHLNSVDPDAAIDFYIRHFPTSVEDELGRPAGARVAEQRPGPVHPGRRAAAHVAADRDLALRLARPRHAREPRDRTGAGRTSRSCRSTPTDDGGSVFVSSDTWPGTGGVLGLTKAQIAEAKATRRAADPHRRLRLHAGARRRARGIRGQPSGRALQPRAPLPGRSVLRAALVPEAPQRAGLRRAHQPRRR